MLNPIATIPLWHHGEQQSVPALVSGEDAAGLLGYRWHLHAGGYACRYENTRSDGRWKSRIVLMHREILGLGPGDPRQGDHINRKRLDNRRENLRVVAGLAEQSQNRTARRGSTSRYLGVYRPRRCRKWRAEVCYRGRRWDLGYFETEAAAAQAASRKRLELMPYAVEQGAAQA